MSETPETQDAWKRGYVAGQEALRLWMMGRRYKGLDIEQLLREHARLAAADNPLAKPYAGIQEAE